MQDQISEKLGPYRRLQLWEKEGLDRYLLEQGGEETGL